MDTDVLVLGGSAAGITAAITAKRYFPDKNVTLLRQEEKVLVPCGIPYIFGTIGDPEKNLIGDNLLTSMGVNLIIDRATRIDKHAKSVYAEETGRINFERMVLATGSLPALPPIKGLPLGNVFVIKKDIPYLKSLQQALDRAQNVVIIGGGFIGVELADECRKGRTANVTVVEMLPHCLALAFDEELCRQAESQLRASGIKILTGAKVEELLGTNQVEQVKFADGTVIPADLVIVAIGVKPNLQLAQEACLKADPRWGIWVDDYMQTSEPGIFAAGDCTEKSSFFGHGPTTLRLASIATHEARVAGANLYGLRRSRAAAIGVFSTMAGSLALGSAGLSEQAAREAGMEVVVGTAKSPDKHPASLPNTQELGVRLIFAKDTGMLIGGQVYGGPSVGEMINIIAIAIQHKMRADELETMQVGTHPLLTASPVAYQLTNAAENAVLNL